MSHLVRILAVVVLAAVSVDGAARQARAVSEAGRVQGRVFAAATGLPIPGATVRLAGRQVSRATPSDDDGYFEFEEVPPGAYLVTAVVSDYAIGAFGQRTPSEVPRSIELHPRETRSAVDIGLTGLGSISGQVVDDALRPIAGVGVQAVRRPRGLTDERPVAFSGGVTDANGLFSVNRLPAGNYFVIATHQPARARSSAPELPSMLTLTSTTYYPGTAVPAEAQAVHVELGSETANVTFTMQPSRLARISGVVVDSRGVPAADAVVTLNPSSTDVPMGALGMTFSEVGVDGSFSLSNVPPGVYSLDVRSKSVYEAIARTGGVGIDTMRGSPEFATVPVHVAGEDIDNAIVRTDRGFTLSGRLIVEGNMTAPGLQPVRISATHVGEVSPMVRFALSGETQPEADGSFEFQKLLGPQMLRVSGLPAGWALKRVRYGGLDVTDMGVDVAFDVPGVEVVIARQSEVLGLVADRRGLSIPGATVVVFAEDSRRWTLPFTRYVKLALSSSSGTFTIAGLPAGRYYAVAVPALIEGKLADPDDLEMLVPRASRFSLGEGERRSLEIRLE